MDKSGIEKLLTDVTRRKDVNEEVKRLLSEAYDQKADREKRIELVKQALDIVLNKFRANLGLVTEEAGKTADLDQANKNADYALDILREDFLKIINKTI